MTAGTSGVRLTSGSVYFPESFDAVEKDNNSDYFHPAKTCIQSLRDGFAIPDPIGLVPEGVVYGFRLAKNVAAPNGLSLVERNVYNIAQDVKELAEVATLPFKALDFLSACHDDDTGVIPRVIVCFARFIACIPSATELFGFLERREVIQVSSQTSTIVGSVGNGALVVGNLYGAAEQIIKLVNAETALQVGLYLLNLGKNVAYAAAAVLALVACIFAIAFAPWLLAVIGTVAVGFALTGFFYDKIFDPDNKNGPKAILDLTPELGYAARIAAQKGAYDMPEQPPAMG